MVVKLCDMAVRLCDMVVRLWQLLSLSVVVLATFTVCWFPFLSSRDLSFQVIHRMFPFARGLFEVCEFSCCNDSKYVLNCYGLSSSVCFVQLCLNCFSSTWTALGY